MYRIEHYISATTILIIGLSLMVLASPRYQNPTEAGSNPQMPAPAFVTGLPDLGQAEDSSVPVFLNGVQMAYGFKEYKDQAGIKGGRLQNRSSQTVIAVKIRWFSTTIKDEKKREKIFQQGELKTFDVHIPPGQNQEVDFKLPGLNEMVARWMEESPNDKRLAMTFVVSEVTFEGGATWKEELVSP